MVAAMVAATVGVRVEAAKGEAAAAKVAAAVKAVTTVAAVKAGAIAGAGTEVVAREQRAFPLLNKAYNSWVY